MSSKARALAPNLRNIRIAGHDEEAIMQKILSPFVTDYVRVTAFSDHVRIRSSHGAEQLVLYGQTLQNIFGNQEMFIPFVDIKGVTSIVGSTTSDKVSGSEGKGFSDLVVERVAESLYRIGYTGDQEKTSGVLLDEAALTSVIRACRVCLTTGDQKEFGYDENFWVVHASFKSDAISISSRIFEIIPAEGIRITIEESKMGIWLEIFSAAELLEPLEPKSMIQVNPATSLYKCRDDVIHLKILEEKRQIGFTAESAFFALCQRLMIAVWLGEDLEEEDWALIDDEDDEEGSAP